jgi:erythromycin esterase
MAENVTWLLDQAGPDAKIILWAHNSHVADVSLPEGTSMGYHLREQYGQDLVIVGFAFYEGQVSVYSVPPAIPGSFGWYAHSTGVPQFMLNLKDLDLRKAETAPTQWLARP